MPIITIVIATELFIFMFFFTVVQEKVNSVGLGWSNPTNFPKKACLQDQPSIMRSESLEDSAR